MIGRLKRLLGGAPSRAPSELAQGLEAELTAVFRHLLEFALLRFGAPASNKAIRQDALDAPMMVYLAEFSLPTLRRLGGAPSALRPLAAAIDGAFAASDEAATEFAEAGLRLRQMALQALDETPAASGPPGDLSHYGKNAPLVAALACASMAREAYDAAAGDGSQPDEDHLLAFSTLVGKDWLEAQAS